MNTYGFGTNLNGERVGITRHARERFYERFNGRDLKCRDLRRLITDIRNGDAELLETRGNTKKWEVFFYDRFIQVVTDRAAKKLVTVM